MKNKDNKELCYSCRQFEARVDYSILYRSTAVNEQIFSEGAFPWGFSPEESECDFPIEETGVKEKILAVFRPRRHAVPEEIRASMVRQGFRPGNWAEIFALGQYYTPDFYIYALGSTYVCTSEDMDGSYEGVFVMPGISFIGGEKRNLALYAFKEDEELLSTLRFIGVKAG